ncbi:MAG: hypothetical protein Tsb0027_13100 [Wenzhouxiangellaceae bacterium]
MNILLITLEPPLNADMAVRGNVVRAAQLYDTLRAAGHQVRQVFRQPYDQSPVVDHGNMYTDAEGLQAFIADFQADALLLGYWALAEDLPEHSELPVIMDFIAPRPLEALFEDEATRDLSLQRLSACLRKADCFLVGNRRQRHLLVPYLLAAGLDLRFHYPVLVLPIAAAPAVSQTRPAPPEHWIIAGGGVQWAWRQQQDYLAVLQDWLPQFNHGDPQAHLVMFGGDYPMIHQPGSDEINALQPDQPCHSLGLQSYRDYCGFLARHVHIGLELAEFNIERYFSQSFRAMEYLRHGIPVICNDYTELAKKITAAEAGWTVQSPQQLPALLQQIMHNPQQWQQRANNALTLLQEQFAPLSAAADLLHYLQQPQRVARTAPLLLAATAAAASPPESAADSSMIDPDQTATAEAAASMQIEASAAEPDQEVATADAEQGLSEEQSIYDRQRSLGSMSWRHLAQQLRHALRRRIPYQGSLRQLPRLLFYRGMVALAGLFAGRVAASEPGNVVIITRADLYPTDHGGAVKIVETARALSRTGRDVAIVTSERHRYWLYRDGVREERKLPFWLKLCSLPQRFSSLLHLSYDVPRSNQFLYLALSDNSFLWRTVHVARRINANVYQAEFPAYARAAFFARRVRGGKVVIVEHNVEYQRLLAQEKSLTAEQFHRLKAMEVDFCNLSDAVICVSRNDRQQLSNDGVGDNLLHIIPHGVDLPSFDAEPVIDVRQRCGWTPERPVLVYHGTYQYPPNLTAMKVMASEVLPRLHARGVRPAVMAVGKMPPPESLHPDMVFTGSVERVAGWLRAADVAVVPLLDGGGTRMKIIDYFACSVPVVSTAKGIEGIEVSNGVEAVITDDWEQMADAIVELLQHQPRHAEMAAAGRAFAEHLDWRALAEDYVHVFTDA